MVSLGFLLAIRTAVPILAKSKHGRRLHPIPPRGFVFPLVCFVFLVAFVPDNRRQRGTWERLARGCHDAAGDWPLSGESKGALEGNGGLP